MQVLVFNVIAKMSKDTCTNSVNIRSDGGLDYPFIYSNNNLKHILNSIHYFKGFNRTENNGKQNKTKM